MPALATPQLPGSGSILSGGVPGTSAQKRPKRAMGGAGGPAPSMAPNGQPQAQPQAPPETFAQLQQSGRARPAPPRPAIQQQPPPHTGVSAAGPLQNQLASSLRSSLANPNPYNSDTVRSIDSALTGQLNQDYVAQRKHLEEDLARRGLSASTIGGGYYGDLAGQQDQALATMRAGLTQSAANAEIAGRTQAQGAAQSNINAQNSQGLSEQQLELQKLLGVGNLGVSQGQLALSGELGRGGLDLNRDQLGLSRELGMGNLDLARTGQSQQYGLAKNAQDIQQSQFGQTFGLSQQQQELARELGLGNLNLSRDQLTQQGSQFDKTFAQQNNQFNQDFGLRKESAADQRNQFGQTLQQQRDIATMSDKTANRGIDSSAAQQQLDYLLRLAGITGIGGLGGSGGTGGTGGTSGGTAGGNGGQQTPNFWDVAPGQKPTVDQFTQAYQYFNPGKPVPNPGSREAQDWLNTHPPTTWKPTNTTTVNFGGKQYTAQEFEQYKQQNPNWWQGGSSQDLSWLRNTPQNFTPDSHLWSQYSGTPTPDTSPFNQAYRDTHTTEQMNADVDKYNFNTAKNDASTALQSFIGAGGVFSDMNPGFGGNTAWRQGSQSTQEFIDQKLREAGYNPDGTRIRS